MSRQGYIPDSQTVLHYPVQRARMWPRSSTGGRILFVFGSHDHDDWPRVFAGLDHFRPDPDLLVVRDHPGVDRVANSWGILRGVPVTIFTEIPRDCPVSNALRNKRVIDFLDSQRRYGATISCLAFPYVDLEMASWDLETILMTKLLEGAGFPVVDGDLVAWGDDYRGADHE